MSFLVNEIKEIDESPTLRIYGAALAITFILTSIFWIFSNEAASLLVEAKQSALPWPGIGIVRTLFLPRELVMFSLVAMGALGVAAVVCQLLHRTSAFFAILTLALFIKVLVFCLDRRMMGNYHYMQMLATFAFLFVRCKLALAQSLFLAFYLAAGTLKLNPEWLSGSAIPPWWVDKWLAQIFYRKAPLLLVFGTHWVVLLELVFVFLLFSNRRSLRWLVLIQCLFFHLASWPIVGFFYPTIMICLLSVFPLSWHFRENGANSKFGWALLSAFAVAQMLPWIDGADFPLHRERSQFSLNMFDTRPDCAALAMVRMPGRTIDLSFPQELLAVRIQCEPAIYYQHAIDLCSEFSNARVDLVLQTRRSTEKKFKVFVNERSLCEKRNSISIWRRNDWIQI